MSARSKAIKGAIIVSGAWLAVKLGLASLPAEVDWKAVHGVAWLGGIGFTMSLFIAGLAFKDAAMNDAAKVGILLGSVIAGGVGWWLLSRRAASKESDALIMDDAA